MKKERLSALGRANKVVLVLRHAKVPLEQHVFSLGVAYDAFPVSPELRVVGGSKSNRARMRWRSSSIRLRSPKSESTLQCGATGPR